MTDIDLLYQKSSGLILQFPKYSFPKEKRFIQLKNSCSSDQLYNYPGSLSQRGTSLGYGQKTQFEQKIKTPGPGAYKISREILKQNQIIMGVGRNKMQTNNFVPKSITHIAPGEYLTSLSTRSLISHSILGRQKERKLDLTPGPGRYDHSVDYGGRINLSNYRSQVNVVIGKSGENVRNSLARSQGLSHTQDKGTPGIGLYNVDIIQENQKGVYFHSKYKSVQGTTFSQSKRLFHYQKHIVPGPGDYKLPSLFH